MNRPKILSRTWWQKRAIQREKDLDADLTVVLVYAHADAVVQVADRYARLTEGNVRALEAKAVGWSTAHARTKANQCPACRTRPINPGHTGPYGPGASLAECCQPCSTTSRAVDHALQPTRNLLEHP